MFVILFPIVTSNSFLPKFLSSLEVFLELSLLAVTSSTLDEFVSSLETLLAVASSTLDECTSSLETLLSVFSV